MLDGAQGYIWGILNGIVNVTDVNVHYIQAEGQGQYKRDLQNYWTAITVIKVLATENRGECVPQRADGEQDWAVTRCWLWELNVYTCIAPDRPPGEAGAACLFTARRASESHCINERGSWKWYTKEGSLLRIRFHCFNYLRRSLFIVIYCL